MDRLARARSYLPYPHHRSEVPWDLSASVPAPNGAKVPRRLRSEGGPDLGALARWCVGSGVLVPRRTERTKGLGNVGAVVHRVRGSEGLGFTLAKVPRRLRSEGGPDLGALAR